ncbi:hypothetical protein [uncultured Methanocorpusculum sp.]|nr:hypothetical protein [uncultured Methanocorpusculum sp.]
MKNLPLVLAAILVIICSAGCVSTPNTIIGTWTSEKLIDFPTPNVTQIVITFNPGCKGTETWVYDDGADYVSNMTWIQNEDGSYAYAYDSWIAIISEDGMYATDEEGRTFVREEGDPLDGYVGTWKAISAYEYNGMLYTIKNEIYANYTGLSFWTNQYGVSDKPWELVWYSYEENTYINYYKAALIHFTILPDGTGIDNYNLTYMKS